LQDPDQTSATIRGTVSWDAAIDDFERSCGLLRKGIAAVGPILFLILIDCCAANTVIAKDQDTDGSICGWEFRFTRRDNRMSSHESDVARFQDQPHDFFSAFV
jgi:hypothetical protein